MKDKILKILQKNDQISIHEIAKKVTGLAITGSFKGFDVISEL